MTTERILDRVRKLLELSHSTNEHEAATAAARAAELMSEHAISEAMLEVVKADDEPATHIAERIVEDGLDASEQTKQRVAWRDRILSPLAVRFDCEAFYGGVENSNLIAFGRESNVAAWKYTGMYLIAEVDRLADEAWLKEGADLAAVGQRPRAWKSAFRLGAADVIHERLYAEHYKRKEKEKAHAKAKAKELAAAAGEAANEQMALVRVSGALEVIAKDRAEVVERFKVRTKGFRATRGMGGATRGRSGYNAGRDAGATVNIAGGGKALPGGKS